MAELLKNMLNPTSIRDLALVVKSEYPSFKVEAFLSSTMDETWDGLELKARGRKISVTLGKYLPKDYKKAISIIDKVIPKCEGFMPMVFPDFVEVYGQDEKDWNISVKALERYTKYGSSEFAVRPFIMKDSERMMEQMYAWTKHENEHVRRLASEGCRPALPWGQALKEFKKDPTPVLPILEALKNDSSLYVRKSVANNLNDISKTHPDLVIKLAKKWYGKTDQTNWVVKHGLRTLLKRANPEALAIFGYHSATLDVTDFKIEKQSLKIGESNAFSFVVVAKDPTKVRLEYGIDYVKANGRTNRKIFQISETSLVANKKKSYMKKHSFANLSTRKHYPGTHSLTLIINGVEKDKLDFELT